MKMKVLRPNFEKHEGLVDVVVQCGLTQEILMKATANLRAFQLTIETGKAHYFSRSRNKLWLKGEESGNFQDVISVKVDCDGDSTVYVVVQKGAGVACHTGARTCFYRDVMGRDLGVPVPNAGDAEALPSIEIDVHEKFLKLAQAGSPVGGAYIPWSISLLESRLRERAKASPEVSYTRKLLDKGVEHCAKKLGEEAIETVIASTSEDAARLISESADLMYHLLVLLKSRDLSFHLVEEELRRREAKSGLEEKASRKP